MFCHLEGDSQQLKYAHIVQAYTCTYRTRMMTARSSMTAEQKCKAGGGDVGVNENGCTMQYDYNNVPKPKWMMGVCISV